MALPRQAHRFPEPEPERPGTHREIRRTRSSRAHEADGRRHGPGGLGRQARLRLGRGEQPRQHVRPGAARMRRRQGGGDFGVPAGGPRRALPGIEVPHGCRGRHRPGRRNHRLLQPVRHRAGLLLGGAGRGGQGGLFRSASREGRGPGHHSSTGHVRRGAHGDRRSRADEAALPRPALQHRPGRAPSENRKPERRLFRCCGLRAGADGPRRRDLAGRRTRDRRRSRYRRLGRARSRHRTATRRRLR